MKNELLAIGNVVDSTDGIGILMAVSDIDNDVCIRYGTYPRFADLYYQRDKVKGVPITAEWLGMLGFEKTGHGDRQLWIERYNFVWRDDLMVGGMSYPDIEYVHQLQNLIHILTGEKAEERL